MFNKNSLQLARNEFRACTVASFASITQTACTVCISRIGDKNVLHSIHSHWLHLVCNFFIQCKYVCHVSNIYFSIDSVTTNNDCFIHTTQQHKQCASHFAAKFNSCCTCCTTGSSTHLKRRHLEWAQMTVEGVRWSLTELVSPELCLK